MKTTTGNAFIKQEVESYDGRIETLGQWEKRRGIEWDGKFLPFPDNRTSENFVIIEHLRTNAYGFYEGRGSDYELFNGTIDEAEKYWDARTIGGVINTAATFTLRGNRISKFKIDRTELVRKQG